MAITTLEAAKAAMGLAACNNTKNALIQQCMPYADQIIKRYCKRELESATYTEYHSGHGRTDLVLRQRPVLTPASITAVYVDQSGAWGQRSGAFGSTSLQTAGTDYALILDAAGVGVSATLARLSVPFPMWGLGGTLYGGPQGPVWPKGQGNIKVVYTAGYTSLPDDLRFAGGQLVAWIIRTAPVGGGGLILTSENLGSYSYSLQVATPGEPPEIGSIREILSHYREFAI